MAAVQASNVALLCVGDRLGIVHTGMIGEDRTSTASTCPAASSGSGKALIRAGGLEAKRAASALK